MKKFFVILTVFAVMFNSCDIFDSTESLNQATVKESQVQNNANALTAYPTPIVKNFLE